MQTLGAKFAYCFLGCEAGAEAGALLAGVELDCGVVCGVEDDGAAGAGAGVVFDCGAGIAGTGVTGAVFAGADLETFSRIEAPLPPALSTRSTRAIAQIMNMIAHQVVA